MKILITGANGFLGRGIIRRLLDDGYPVIATDLSTDFVDNRATRTNCDLFEIDNPYEFFQQPDVLLHLAWRDGFVHASPNHFGDLSRHQRFLSSMFVSGINRIAVMGTMHEVGFYEGSIDENTPCNPMNLYGIAKNALRQAVAQMAKSVGKPYQWLRAYYIVDYSETGNSIFSKIAQAVEQGKKEFPFTSGQNQYDFLDYDVFCEQVAATLEQSEVDGVINICSGRPEKLADRVTRFIEDHKLDIQLQYGAYPDRPYDSKAVWGNSQKIQTIMKAYHT